MEEELAAKKKRKKKKDARKKREAEEAVELASALAVAAEEQLAAELAAREDSVGGTATEVAAAEASVEAEAVPKALQAEAAAASHHAQHSAGAGFEEVKPEAGKELADEVLAAAELEAKDAAAAELQEEQEAEEQDDDDEEEEEEEDDDDSDDSDSDEAVNMRAHIVRKQQPSDEDTKAKHVQAQTRMCNSALHLRIRLQSTLDAANRLPQVSDLPCNVRREGGESLVIGGPSLVILEGGEGGIPCTWRAIP